MFGDSNANPALGFGLRLRAGGSAAGAVKVARIKPAHGRTPGPNKKAAGAGGAGGPQIVMDQLPFWEVAANPFDRLEEVTVAHVRNASVQTVQAIYRRPRRGKAVEFRVFIRHVVDAQS